MKKRLKTGTDRAVAKIGDRYIAGRSWRELLTDFDFNLVVTFSLIGLLLALNLMFAFPTPASSELRCLSGTHVLGIGIGLSRFAALRDYVQFAANNGHRYCALRWTAVRHPLANRSMRDCGHGPSPLGGGGGITAPPIPRMRSSIAAA